MEQKTLKIRMSYMVEGDAFIEVPIDWTLDQATDYAVKNIQELEPPNHPEYIMDSAEVDEYSSEFVDRSEI